MKTVFDFSNYRDFLNNFMYGEDAKRGRQSEVAKAMGCQASYLVQVAKGKSELTEDQAFRLGDHLNWSELETDYFTLLLRISRAATPSLKNFLEAKRKTLLRKSENLETKVGSKPLLNSEKFLAQYFSSGIPSTIHMATSSPKFSKPQQIADRLSLSLELVEDNLRFLERYGLIKKEGSDFRFAGSSMHLPKNSVLNEAHQTGRRMQAIRSIQENSKEALHFSSVFTLDKKQFDELKNLFAKFVQESHEHIHSGGTDELYSMCLDLFKVV